MLPPPAFAGACDMCTLMCTTTFTCQQHCNQRRSWESRKHCGAFCHFGTHFAPQAAEGIRLAAAVGAARGCSGCCHRSPRWRQQRQARGVCDKGARQQRQQRFGRCSAGSQAPDTCCIHAWHGSGDLAHAVRTTHPAISSVAYVAYVAFSALEDVKCCLVSDAGRPDACGACQLCAVE